ncbi:subtilisin-like proprotein convertase family protein [Kutzneria kofuensis]|uniref:Subtilisin-like proprotein convertase family protein n=1 Tax=Kutzneria kofuensis TaxID=103725 RepID=A0A7W9KAI4_9PSEU|nr:subtilisin-like proprotein convertase family protein [Kutzneria kofuensis]
MRRSVRPRTTLLAAGAACLTAVLGLASPATAAPHPNPGLMAANTAAQIAALQQLKQSESTSDRKVDSRLLVENKLRTDRSARAVLPQAQSGVKVNGNTVLVDIRATKTTDALVDAVRKAGGQVRDVSQREATVRADVPLSALSTLATRDDIKQIEPGSDAMTSAESFGSGAPGRISSQPDPVSKQTRDARVEQATKAATMRATVAAAVTSQGDRAHAADTARQQNGISGVGTKLCALSDGVSSLAASVASGELPPVDVLPGQEGSGDEGTAMLEIMHDVAPGAALGFATAFNGDASFADNIRALRSQAHCDVIVDDVFYFNEAAFQDGPIAQAVNAVTADGALYFSSAGNEGNVVDGTSGHWEGDYVDSGQVIGKFAGGAHNFAGSTGGTQILEPLSAASSGVPITLWWNDPLQAATDDYDLYLIDSAGNVVSFSQNLQTGTQDPYERVNTTAGGQRLAIVKFKGDNKYLSLSALRGRFVDSGSLKAYVTPGQTSGHSAAKDAYSVAAAPAAAAFGRPLEPNDPANPAGPFPGTFGPTSKIERFSSDGPRKIFFKADGTPGAEVRQKPDITAADGVATSVAGFSPFFGTSAAAPHAAAIAGLVLSGNPGMSPADVRQALTATAVDIAAPGVDNRTGAGVILADKVLAYTGASPQPLAAAQAPTVKGPNGSPYVKPGDTATVTLPVYNGGDGTAASTSVVVDSPTPGVTIAPRSKRYGTIEAGQTVINSFTLTVPATQQLGVPVVLNAKVTFAGAHSPTTQTFQIPVGQPSPVAQTFAFAGDAVAIPDNSTVGASVSIPVSGVGRASKLTFSIDGTACSTTAGSTTVGLDHTYAGDLTGTLTSPSGATAVLFQRRGGAGHNLCQVVFDDSAATAFSTVSSANAPFTGTWKPQTALGSLLADPVDGTWTFKVVDGGPVDTGNIRAVSLHINGFVS